MNPAPLFLFLSPLAILLSLPLIFRMVKMNGVYGVRIPESFRSEARWYQLNRFGGILGLLWGIVLGITGAIGVTLKHSQLAKFSFISVVVTLGGLVLVIVGIYVYAAMTKTDLPDTKVGKKRRSRWARRYRNK